MYKPTTTHLVPSATPFFTPSLPCAPVGFVSISPFYIYFTYLFHLPFHLYSFFQLHNLHRFYPCLLIVILLDTLPSPRSWLLTSGWKSWGSMNLSSLTGQWWRVNSFRFVCLHVSEDLSWAQHADPITKKAHQQPYFFRRLREFKASFLGTTDLWWGVSSSGKVRNCKIPPSGLQKSTAKGDTRQ